MSTRRLPKAHCIPTAGGGLFGASPSEAPFFQMLKSTVYFVAQKTLYHNVPMNGGVW